MPKRKATSRCIQNRKRSRYQQYGRGSFPVFVGQPLQHGYGLGGVFRSLFSKAVPFLKKGLTRVGERALTAGARALADVGTNDTSLKTAMKRQIKNEINTLKGINRTAVSRKPTIQRRSRKRVRAKQKGGFKKITL